MFRDVLSALDEDWFGGERPLEWYELLQWLLIISGLHTALQPDYLPDWPHGFNASRGSRA